jgi:hypothetical protein
MISQALLSMEPWMSSSSRKTCIYCGKKNKLSGEHIIADWVRKSVPRRGLEGGAGRTVKNSLLSVSAKSPGNAESSYKNGHIGSHKIYNVCESCNNGWMKGIQDAAKPVIDPLMRGVWSGLNRNSSEMISSWVAMTVMNVDAAEERGGGIPQKDRYFLFSKKSPPPCMNIFIGRKTGGDEYLVTHCPMRVSQKGSPSPTKHTSQITTLSIGQLVVHAYSFPDFIKPVNPFVYGQNFGVIPVYPIWMGDCLPWQTAPILTKDELNKLSFEMFGIYFERKVDGFA